MKLLVLSSRFPFPTERGDKLRLYHQIKGWSKEHEVFLFSLSFEDISTSNYEEVAPYCKEVFVHRIPKSTQAWAFIKSLFSQEPTQVKLYNYPHIIEALEKVVAQINPDITWCQLIRMAPYGMKSQGVKVLDYMDAYGVGMKRRAALVNPLLGWFYRRESHRTIAYEKQVADQFEVKTIISKQDQLLLDLTCEVVPNGIDTSHFCPRPSKKLYDIGFIGNMGYLPNMNAAQILCKEIIPAYESKYQVKLNVIIAGARPHPTIKALSNNFIKVTGWIHDIREAYADCKVLCAPLYNGTGQQNKVLEGMAMGIPCITTTEVNGAIGAMPEQEIIIAENTAEFVEAIEKLLNDETYYQQIAHNARNFVQNNYTWESSIALTHQIFERLNND